MKYDITNKRVTHLKQNVFTVDDDATGEQHRYSLENIDAEIVKLQSKISYWQSIKTQAEAAGATRL